MLNKLNKPFLIAELSANHDGKLNNAIKLIKYAKKFGADAVKLQTYTPDWMTLKSKKKYFKIKKGLWAGYTLWDLYNKGKTPIEWHHKLFKLAKDLKIKIFSTPFDKKAVDILEDLICKIYKISSFEINDIELIRYVAKTKKPMIISTGMADLEEIDLAYRTAKKNGCNDISLLYCVSSYPSKINEFNLNNIKILKKRYNCEVGLSDHSNNKIIPAISAGFGAKIFEKHIAIPGLKKSLDYEFSLKGKEINEYKKLITDAALVTKNSNFTRIKSELGNRRFRRSIFSTRKIRKGEKFTEENIKIIRPGHGIDPKYFKNLIGKISKNNYSDSVPLKKKEIVK